MSETETESLDAQISDLTERAHVAFRSGNHAEADRLFSKRNALSESRDPEDGEAPEAEEEDSPLTVEDFEEEEQDFSEEAPLDVPQPINEQEHGYALEHLEAAGVDQDALQILDQQWGADALDNLAYARSFAERVMEEHPELDALVTEALERDPAKILTVLEEAARLGREAAHGSPAEALRVAWEKAGKAPPPKGVRLTAMKDPDTGETLPAAEQLDELTRLAHEAHERGDRTRAQRLFSQREALAQKLNGKAPIVGHEGRSV